MSAFSARLRTEFKRKMRTDADGQHMQYADMTDAEDITAQVKALRERAGLSVRKLATRMGKSSSGYLHYESPDRFKGGPLPVAFARELAAALAPEGIPAEDVFRLTGLPAPEAEQAVADLVNVYDVQASAGNGVVVYDEQAVAQLAFPPGYLARLTSAKPYDLKIISVKGDSMLPTLADDDVVMLDISKRDLSYDGLFVIRDGGDALLVKRIGRASQRGFVTIISDNRNVYPSVEKSLQDIEVVGRVIWRGGKV
ncbi:helix-turn-helix transcriptional regulator [Cereibacter sphaeroides]|nr:helix-turn-helix transcriptional regulator [Cereibacter sphaeroides]